MNKHEFKSGSITDSDDERIPVESVTNRTDIDIKGDETAFPTLYVATIFGKNVKIQLVIE